MDPLSVITLPLSRPNGVVPFSGRVGRITGQAVIHVERQIQQGKDLLLETSERRQMTPGLLGRDP